MCTILSGNTAADARNTHWKHVLKVHCDSSPLAKASRYKTFCMRVFARRTFLRFRYCSIRVKMHVLLTYSAVKRRVSMGSRNLVPAVTPMSGSPTFDTEKNPEKNPRNGGILRLRLSYGRRSK